MHQQGHNGPSMPPMQPMAHWQFWAPAMAVYPRAWIFMVGSQCTPPNAPRGRTSRNCRSSSSSQFKTPQNCRPRENRAEVGASVNALLQLSPFFTHPS
jgi:hypothetical protein